MKRAAAEARIVFHLFDFRLHRLLIARGHVARRIFAFFACFSAFDNNGFSWHDVMFPKKFLNEFSIMDF